MRHPPVLHILRAAMLGVQPALLLALGAVAMPAWAADPVPSHATGADLHAWGALEQRRLAGADAVAAYRGFAAAWPDSPLAEAAWQRLVELGAATVDPGDGLAVADRPADRAALARVRARWLERQRVLARLQRTAPAAVASRTVRDLDAAPAAAVALRPTP